jgi:hypothetical protein
LGRARRRGGQSCLDDPSLYGGAQMAIFTAEGQAFHLIADGVPAFEGLPPRQ